MSETPILEIKGLSQTLGNASILEDVSFCVNEKEVVSIIGANGAGKSTLLKCLVRIHKINAGSIRIFGQEVDDYSSKALAKLIAYVPQADNSPAPFSVYDFVMLGRYPHLSAFSAPSEDDHKAVQQALERTETTEFADRILSTLSGGERQKVLLAAALAQGAKILILDEPTAFLDPKHIADVHRLLINANKHHGITVIVVTHDINRASLVSTRVLALRDRRVAFFGKPKDLMNEKVLNEIYDTEFFFSPHPATNAPIIVPEVLE